MKIRYQALMLLLNLHSLNLLKIIELVAYMWH